jgi:hypothetical protein
MMADLYPVAGAKFFIGNASMAAPSDDVDAADFASVTWVRVSDWTNMGAIGDSAALISTDVIDRGRTVKQKGTFNSGSMQNTFAVNADDAGQLAIIAASQSPNNYPFKIEFDDAPQGGTPTEKYFIGIVMSAQEQGGGANTARLLSATVEVNTNVVTVPAAA